MAHAGLGRFESKTMDVGVPNARRLERNTWLVSAFQNIGMTVAVIAALILGAAAAAYARSGGDVQNEGVAPSPAEMRVH
jgi:hypothetical protein